MLRPSNSGLHFRYIAPRPSVIPDHATKLPAFRLTIRHDDGRGGEAWLIAKRGRDLASLPLAKVLGPSANAGQEITLWMARPPTPVKSYKSDIAVMRDGKLVSQKVVEVNRPLHYGGYHFYQDSYDAEDQQYTVLSVTSDSGVLWVYVGMFLLLGGSAWRFYARPVVIYFRKDRTDGD